MAESAVSEPDAAHIGPQWQLFHSNRTAWHAAFELCEEAAQTIAVEQYIFSRKGVGDRLLDLLTSRARQGVQVRVLADAFGSRHLPYSAGARELCRAGGEVLHFHGMRDFLRDPRTLYHRLHRKTVICDSDTLLTGGSCFSPRMADWRDTMIKINGQVAQDALETFETTWRAAKGIAIEPHPPHHKAPEHTFSGWSYVVSSPYPPAGREYYRLLIERLETARNSVMFTTPYFIPDQRFWQCVTSVAQRGVRVRLLLPARSDQPLIDLFSHHYARKLGREGVEVYGYLPGMLHAKLAVIDDDYAAVGSFNLGIDSFKMNLEGAVVTVSPGFVRALAAQLEDDFTAAKRL
jgi:cardiolipin synthase A/B